MAGYLGTEPGLLDRIKKDEEEKKRKEEEKKNATNLFDRMDVEESGVDLEDKPSDPTQVPWLDKMKSAETKEGETVPTNGQSKSLKDNINRLENPKDEATAITQWESLRDALDKKEEKLIAYQEAETGKLIDREQQAKAKANIQLVVKQLINAAALLYAAKKGIQGDIKLADPNNIDKIREIEREMDYRRNLLKDKIDTLRRKNYKITEMEGTELRRAEESKEAGERAAVSEAERRRREDLARSKEERSEKSKLEREVRSNTYKEMKDLVKLFGPAKEEDNEAVTEYLINLGVPSSQAEELSGQASFPDSTPNWNEIRQIIQRNKAAEIGISDVPVEQTRDESVYVTVRDPASGQTRKIPRENIQKAKDRGLEILD